MWDVERTIGDQETLLRHFGGAIELFLKLQQTEDPVNQIAFKQSLTKHENPKILLTKTPNVEGLENFFYLFPDAYLILLIRDGRAVVESGVKSFDWNYEDAMWRWRNRAQKILDFKEKYKNINNKFMILKYEDLVIDEKKNLLKIFDFLGIDHELFDFDRAQSLGVTGSSDLRKKAGTIHWKEQNKKRDFNPLLRFSNWDRKKHERFNWIAGQQMTEIGYELNLIKNKRALCIIRNKFFDLKMILRTNSSNIVRKTLKVLKKLV